MDAQPKARTEVARVAKSLPEELDKKVLAIRNAAFVAEREGRDNVAGMHYQEAWALLPEPREIWDSSLIIALDTVDFFFKKKQYDKAAEWLRIADRAAEGTRNSDILLRIGKIRFECGEFDAAYRAFDELYKTWGTRPFLYEDPLYLEFYETREK